MKKGYKARVISAEAIVLSYPEIQKEGSPKSPAAPFQRTGMHEDK